MTDPSTEAQAIIDACGELEPVHLVEAGNIYAVRQAGGSFTKLDLTGDEYRDFPKRKAGQVTVTDVASFAHYYAKHADNGSEVFADLAAATITAVLDAHGASARWQDHRLTLAMQQTPQWKAWVATDRRMMSQASFAEWIEDHAADIAPGGPCTAADLLEMAQQFQAHTKVEFKSGKRLKDGQTQLLYSETTEAKAGERGIIHIPDAFELAIAPFEDSEFYRVKARFRYRLNGGDLTMAYHLNDPEKVFRDAILQVTGKTEEACKVTIMRGQPA